MFLFSPLSRRLIKQSIISSGRQYLRVVYHDDFLTRRYHSHNRRAVYVCLLFQNRHVFCSSVDIFALNEITGSNSSVLENIFLNNDTQLLIAGPVQI
ncbi:MAG: hypothetical protein GPOALKHO_000483 [Sodalis sp.]|nr:MAG: hypothetical protein GPOALKHO_000483 [Sodalis sp.]